MLVIWRRPRGSVGGTGPSGQCRSTGMPFDIWSKFSCTYIKLATVVIILLSTVGSSVGERLTSGDADNRRQETGAGDRKPCYGTDSGFSIVNVSGGLVKRLRDTYSNCTIVHGNLEIVDITWDKVTSEGISSLDFFDNIEEVVGYVLIARNSLPGLSFPRLKIIWGDSTFSPRVSNTNTNTNTNNLGNFSLLVVNNAFNTVEMRSLRAIMEGQVGIIGNRHMCHWKTNAIDWTQILGENYKSQNRLITDVDRNNDECFNEPGSGTCSRECEGQHCWALGPEYCQAIYRKNCAPQCGNDMCFNTSNPFSCCSLQCAAGCFGPTSSQCHGCRSMVDDGLCVDRCPAREVYNRKTAQYELNPNGKFAWNRECVRECPENMFVYKDGCVNRCPEGYFAENTTICQPCKGACPKVCTIEKPLTSLNIHQLVNCTVIDGPIEITQATFDGSNDFDDIAKTFTRYDGISEADLNVLETVEVVGHYVFIQGKELKSLHFLRNLKRIDGRRRFNERYSLSVSGSDNLVELGMRSLNHISTGDVVIAGNPKLCLADSLQWKTIAPASHVRISSNRPISQCVSDGVTCDDSCNNSTGCWGIGPQMCFECQHYERNQTCTKNCLQSENLYSIGKKCDMCDEECAGCKGPGPQQCISCLHVQLAGTCMKRCPDDTHYTNSDNRCLPCHPNCFGFGCTGPGSFLGLGGCKKCKLGLVKDNSQIECLPEYKDCRLYENLKNYYMTAPRDQLRMQVELACFKCKDVCETCQGDGVDYPSCQCNKYLFNDTANSISTCVAKCPSNTWVSSTEDPTKPITCYPCHKECETCYGENSTQCYKCKNYMDHVDEERSEFNCTDRCPPDRPYSKNDTCTAEDPTWEAELWQKKKEMMYGIGISLVFFILMIVCTLAFVKWRRWKANSYLQPEDEIMDINPDAKPNLAQLRLILETELRRDGRRSGQLGSGAFGVVYKGVWYPNDAKAKYFVAIKVLHESTSAAETEMLLSEAAIMASMEHCYLLPLKGVCMARQLMLITPLIPLGNLLEYVQNNRSQIGSKALLRWSVQIACGMAYLEERRLVHRDLAARNVLVQRPDHIRITDFGLAKMLEYGKDELNISGGKMPIKWLALECIQFKRYTHKSDVWAYGVTIWELLTFGEKPYKDVPLQQIPYLLEKGERLPQPKICSLDVYMILIKCWMVDAETRPSFKELAEKFNQMMKDPGRYLVIEGDALLRLPNYSPNEYKQMAEQLVDDPEAGDTDDLLSSISLSPVTPVSPNNPCLENGCAIDSSTPRMRDTSGRVRSGQRQQSTSSHRYASDPLRKAGKVEDLPSLNSPTTDGDNYLVPDSQLHNKQGKQGFVFSGTQDNALTYTQVIDSGSGGGQNGGPGKDYYQSLRSAISGAMDTDSNVGLDNQVYIMQAHSDSDSEKGQKLTKSHVYDDSDPCGRSDCTDNEMVTENESVV